MACQLSDDIQSAFFDADSSTWTVTDQLLEQIDNNWDQLIACTPESGILRIETSDTLQPPRVINISRAITIRSEETAAFTCPEDDQPVFSLTYVSSWIAGGSRFCFVGMLRM